MLNDEDILLTTARFSVNQVEQTLADGTVMARQVVRHPGSVVIIPFVDDDHVCLIQNFRVSLNQTLIELPAGTLETGEDPQQCAFRELAEETGYRATSMNKLFEFYPAPGILDEKMHLFAAYGLTAGSPAREANEQIENLVLSWASILSHIEGQKIADGKTLMSLLYCLQKPEIVKGS